MLAFRRLLLLALPLCACETADRAAIPAADSGAAEATSLTGAPLVPPALPDSVRLRYEERLREAEADLARDPASADAAIWVGRRLAYLGRYREAIDTFTSAIARHPDDPRLHRHRGHRYITVRRLDDAITDLGRAAELIRGRADEIEPDGLPNARGIPTSTLQSNIWYHLGLAYYLRGDFAQAHDAYREALRVSTNPDMLVATTHWAYMTRRRMGDSTGAAALLARISREMEIIENDAYHRLLLLYKGEIEPDSLMVTAGSADGITDATLGYGVANWHLYNGRPAEAVALFERVVTGPQWAAFGYIAAEAELARGTAG
ncbi:MAG TPA: tetratricopeptide repeat protein [Gemmatimonadaceae bacterium]|nr:tetratricopeptide repeat protein [Gemmatimonadaceae bacterium]